MMIILVVINMRIVIVMICMAIVVAMTMVARSDCNHQYMYDNGTRNGDKNDDNRYNNCEHIATTNITPVTKCMAIVLTIIIMTVGPPSRFHIPEELCYTSLRICGPTPASLTINV